MPELIPAPSPVAPLAAGERSITMGTKEAARIVPGAGIAARVTDRDLLIDGVLSDPPESFDLWRAGAIAADAELGVWKNTARGRAVYVRKLLANLRTAQTVADAANYYRLKITDSAGAVAVLPMTATVRTFLLDQGYGSILDSRYVQPAGSIGFSVAHVGYGTAHRFTVAQQLDITGLQERGVRTIRSSATAVALGTRVRGAILDDKGRVLASGYSAVSDDKNVTRYFPFDVSLRLLPAVGYWLAFDCFETPPVRDIPTDPARLGFYQPSAAGTALALMTFTGERWSVDYASPQDQPQTAALQALRWPAILAGTAVSAPGFTVTTGGFSSTGHDWSVLGSPSGLALLSGDLTFAIDTVGAPVAGAAGADLNLHAVLTVT